MLSSPDPLTFVTSSPSKSAATRRSAKRAAQPLSQLSPNVQPSDPFLDLANPSPSKSITMTTPKAAGSSPWRIKVTVEAQPHNGLSQDENSPSSPTEARSARIATRTTTIPLNDANGSSPVKRRGRPRKADAQTTTVPLNDARDSSPVKKRGKAKKADPAPAPARTRNGTPVRKPRKSVTRSPESSEVDSSLSDASYHPSNRGPTRIWRSISKDINVPEPIRAAAMYGPRSEQFEDEMEEVQSETLRPNRSSLGQRRRLMRTGFRLGEAAVDTIEQQVEDHEQTPKASSSKKATADEAMWRSMVSTHEYESEQTAEKESNSSDDDLDIVMPDQTIGDTTMLHSEEFSMVSLYSLPSMQAARNGASPGEALPTNPKLPSLRTDPIPQARKPQLSRQTLSSPPDIGDSVASVSYMPSSPPIRFAERTPGPQNPNSPSVPPAIQQVELSSSKAETPKLVNVVKAGIALQGIVNGNNRGTQDRRPSDDIREEAQRARLDDMFSQFHSGTRRELQAGLRLGEQLAERARSRNATRESSHDEPNQDAKVERSTAPESSGASDSNVFDGPSASRSPNQDLTNHRLPTPDDNDYALPSPPPPPSQLLTLQPELAANPAQPQLISPARSQASPDAEEMTDGARTPPSVEKNPANIYRTHQDSGLRRQSSEDYDDHWQPHHERGSGMVDEADPSQVVELSSDPSESSGTSTESSENPLDGDIWEEEGGRASNSRFARRAQRAAAKRSGVKTNESAGSSSSRRGNVSKNAQQQSSSTSTNSMQQSGSSDGSSGTRNSSGRLYSRAQRSSRQESPEPAHISEAGYEAESTEDTGLFWQRSSESPQPRTAPIESNKLDLSMLMAINDSPAKDLQGPVLTTPPKLQPIKAPYNFGTGLNSPVRGSPLKQQVLFSSPSAVNSSPYHKIEHTIASSVLEDGDTMVIDEENMTQLAQQDHTHTFDGRARVIAPSPAVFAEEDLMVQRQIENELTPRSARIKNLNLSGDGKRLFTNDESTMQSESSMMADQSSYLAQKQAEQFVNRSSQLGRSSNQLSAHVSRSSRLEQPRIEKEQFCMEERSRIDEQHSRMEEEQSYESSVFRSRSRMTALNVNRERRPLFQQKAVAEQKKRAPLFEQRPLSQAPTRAPAPAPQPAAQAVAQPEEEQPTAGLFGRLWGAIAASSEPEAPLPLHPLAKRYKPLPRIAPWTKTHWDALDRIYQRYKRHPDEFSPNDPLHKALLAQKVQWTPDSSKTKPTSDHVGVEMQNWGYTVKITPEFLVCCVIFRQLLTLKDAAEYRRVTGKDVERGNFMQRDRSGDLITMRDVIGRLFAAVAGEMVRADEKRGVRVRRDLDQFLVKYPWAPGWWDDMGKFVRD